MKNAAMLVVVFLAVASIAGAEEDHAKKRHVGVSIGWGNWHSTYGAAVAVPLNNRFAVSAGLGRVSGFTTVSGGARAYLTGPKAHGCGGFWIGGG